MILVLGAGPTGLTTALLLARDGHDVTVLERDPAPPPPDPWADWDRAGVAQFRQLHLLLPRWRAVMEAELPEVPAAVLAAGGLRTTMLRPGTRQPGDEQFDLVTARRPVAEAVLARCAADSAGIRIRRGVAVTGLLTDRPGPIPRVTGVRTDAGDLTADLVVDAGGRRSRVPALLAAAGVGTGTEERADCGFVYYARQFRAPGGRLPVPVDGMLTHCPSVSVLTLPADSGTYAVALITSARDRELRTLRHEPCWTAAVRAYPVAAHWLDGEPTTGITVMAGIEDRRRQLVVDGEPVVTGLVLVGDAAACTNPSLGRGMSIGALQAAVLRDALARAGTPEDLVLRYAAASAATVTPYVDATLAFDRHRLAEIDADLAGEPYRPQDPGWAMSTAMAAGARQDPVVGRAYAAISGMLATPRELFADPALVERVRSYVGRPHHAPGPTRPELLNLTRAGI